ncbi:MAG TPA: CRTAC1 family protein [Candidatus Wunengus sp. YC63]|uniref:CRTAC1 family protein n=1 Tax=Candidatus Wunengus sp. YC63 TaxID=3367699 RepID=UPI0027129C6B|nr:CRTAC1 family protein [Candidatus Brocadiales bacterium]
MDKIKNKSNIFHYAGIVFSFTLVMGCIYPGVVFSQVTFTDVTESANVSNNSPGLGAAWGDYNNDGFLDIYVSNYNDVNILYKNNGDGSFSNVSSSAGVDDDSTGADIAWGDYNNDGFLDLYLVNDVGAGYGAKNILYKNNGDGTFTNVADAAGVSSRGYGLCAAWADYNNDGLLDLYVTNNAHSIFCNGQSNKLYKNKGDGTFGDVTDTAGVGEKGNSTGVAWGDFDGDGDQDVCVINFASPFLEPPEGNPSVLYQNNNDGTFTDISSSAGIEHIDGGHGVAWGDYDNDGYMDFYIANNSALLSQSPQVFSSGKNVLYRNNSNGTFTDVTDEAGVGSTLTSIEVSWVDYDNDGDLDLHVVNGGIQGNQSSVLYENNNGTFSDVAGSAGIQNTGPGEGATWGDYDNDGDMDLYVVNYRQSNKLYRNNGNSNHWIIIKPVGTTSNRAGIGARIKATTGTTIQIREVDGGSGFCSQDSLWVHFGLGSNETIDTLEIQWPGGKVQILNNVTADQILSITEE